MVEIDVPLAAAIGSTLGVGARDMLASESDVWRNRYVVMAVAFVGVFVTPATLYYLSAWPAWDTMYLWDPGTLPAWVPPAFVLAQLLAAAAGFCATHAVLRRGRTRLAGFLPVLLALPVVVITVAFYPRVLHVGTVASYAAGGPWNFWRTPLCFPGLLLLVLYIFVPLVILYRRLRHGAT